MTNNIILTGIPRAGTTLACFLLNKLPDVVALHEPIADWGEQRQPNALCNRIERFLAESRETLLQTGTAISKQVNGKVPDNPKGDYSLRSRLLRNYLFIRNVPGGRSNLRKSIVSRGLIQVDKPLTEDFLLCIKHNGHFISLLDPLLARGYPCYAIIRHPLAILASWNSIDFAPYDGHMYAAEQLNPLLSRQLNGITDRFKRQLYLLNWFFETLHQQLPASHIIRYEELISSKGTVLKSITPLAQTLNAKLENKNNNKLYNQQLMASQAKMLAQSNGAFWHYYERESIVAFEMEKRL